MDQLFDRSYREFGPAMILRFTRNWIHYGFLGHTTFCICVAAIKGLFGG